MTDDLTTRLRTEASYWLGGNRTKLVLEDAAARIEALEAECAARDAVIAELGVPADQQHPSDEVTRCAWCDVRACGWAKLEPGYGVDQPSCGEHGADFRVDPALMPILPAVQRTADRETIARALLARSLDRLGPGYPTEAITWEVTDQESWRQDADAVLAVLVPADQVRAETLAWAAAQGYLVGDLGLIQEFYRKAAGA